MLDFFESDEARNVFLRRLSALSHNTDFIEIMGVLEAYRDSVDALLRYVEVDSNLRQLQGKSQLATNFLNLFESAKTNKF